MSRPKVLKLGGLLSFYRAAKKGHARVPYVVHCAVADIRKLSHGEERPEADLQGKRVRTVFCETEAGREPVRE